MREIDAEASQDISGMTMFSSLDLTPVDLLTQSAFYADHFVVPDPVLPLTRIENTFTKHMRLCLQMPEPGLDRRKIAGVMLYLKTLTPMVAANYVKFMPLSFVFEPPEQLPLYFSENQFSDALPEEIMSFFRTNASVKSLTKHSEGLIEENDLYPSRGISVTFRNHSSSAAMFFFLFEQGRTVLEESTRYMQAEMLLPDEPPSQERFDVWVNQSINRTAINFYNRVTTEIYMSTRCGAMYITRSPFVSNLLGLALPQEREAEEEMAEEFLSLELPFLANVDIETLMTIRTNEGEAFARFREEFDLKLRDLRLEADPESVRIKKDNLVNEICNVQLRRVDSEIKSVRNKYLADAAIGVAGLVAAVQTSGWSVLSSATALAHGVRSYLQYRQTVGNNPAFFLWKILKRSI